MPYIPPLHVLYRDRHIYSRVSEHSYTCNHEQTDRSILLDRVTDARSSQCVTGCCRLSPLLHTEDDERLPKETKKKKRRYSNICFTCINEKLNLKKKRLKKKYEKSLKIKREETAASLSSCAAWPTNTRPWRTKIHAQLPVSFFLWFEKRENAIE